MKISELKNRLKKAEGLRGLHSNASLLEELILGGSESDSEYSDATIPETDSIADLAKALGLVSAAGFEYKKHNSTSFDKYGIEILSDRRSALEVAFNHLDPQISIALIDAVPSIQSLRLHGLLDIFSHSKKSDESIQKLKTIFNKTCKSSPLAFAVENGLWQQAFILWNIGFDAHQKIKIEGKSLTAFQLALQTESMDSAFCSEIIKDSLFSTAFPKNTINHGLIIDVLKYGNKNHTEVLLSELDKALKPEGKEGIQYVDPKGRNLLELLLKHAPICSSSIQIGKYLVQKNPGLVEHTAPNGKKAQDYNPEFFSLLPKVDPAWKFLEKESKKESEKRRGTKI